MKIWHPYTQEATDLPPIEIDRGEGAYLYTRDGRRLIDDKSVAYRLGRCAARLERRR